MKILDKIRGAIASTDEGYVPQSAVFATRPDTIYAPVSGLLINLEELNDEVISSKLLGEGYGILPVGDAIYAPTDCRVVATTVTNHSIGLLTTTGAEIIIHIGLGTVAMNGKGFSCYVKQGDDVKAGTPLIGFDSNAIHDAGYEDVITVIVSKTNDDCTVQHAGNSNTLIGGRPLVKIGDPLLLLG